MKKSFLIIKNIYTFIIIYWFSGEKKKNCCPSCDSNIIIQIEEEPLPSSSDKLEKNLEIASQNLIEDNNSNDLTPINSRSSKIIIQIKYCLYTILYAIYYILWRM